MATLTGNIIPTTSDGRYSRLYTVYTTTDSGSNFTISGDVYLYTHRSEAGYGVYVLGEVNDCLVKIDGEAITSSMSGTCDAWAESEIAPIDNTEKIGSFSKTISKKTTSYDIRLSLSGVLYVVRGNESGFKSGTSSGYVDITVPALPTSSVTLNMNGGSGGTQSVTATYGSAMPAITAPTRTGYTFAGYYDATSGGTQYYTSTGASARAWDKTAATTLYARWTAQTSSVTLNMNGGSGGTTTIKATYASAMPAITKPTLSGWTFQGYYDTSASTGGTQYYTAAGASARTWNKTGTQTLYARWSRSITFKHGKSNASSNAVTQYKGGNVTPPSITAISGWTALGWRDDTTAGAKEYGANNTTAFAYTGTATTLYAAYSRTLTLSYTNGGGSGTAPSNTTATQYYNSYGVVSSASFTLQANTFTAPTDVGGGWAFSKWGAGNASGTWPWGPGVDASASTSTAAVWTRTVTFKSGVNSATSKTATQTRGSAVSVPSGTVTPSGWTLLGWRTDTTASTASYTGSSFSPSATTLYAVFSRTLTLSYTNGGGTGTAPSNTTATQYYNSYGNKSTASFTLRANTFTRAGYYFSKWEAGNANATWSWSPAVDAAVSTSTAAQWVAYKITLTYNVNGGTIADSPHKYNDTTYFKVSNNLVVSSTTSSGTYANVTATINTATAYANLWNVGSFNVTKTGYHIDGADAYICDGVLVNQDDSETNTTNKVTVARLNGGTTLTADISKTLSINWKANTYTVTLNKNNGSGGTDSVTATYNSAMPAATMPTRTGYTFNGYYDATSGGIQYYTAAGASTRAWNKTSNTTLYAQWTEKTATLTYNNSGLSGSTVPSAVTMKYTTATTLTAGTAPSNYSFYGWATSDANAKAGTRAYTGTQQYKAANVVPSAATLYAIWYGTVTYNANGHGTAPSATTMYYTPQPKAAAAISATGYTFNGWNTKADGTGTNYTAGSTVLKNANEYKANYTLYAKWTANTYTVTFDRNGGTGGTATATATYDAAMPSITKPTRAGYKFEGYYDAASGGTQYYTAAGASARAWNKTAATTLYAHWSATSSFISGDYKFTVLSTGKVRVEAADKTKTTYAAIPTTVPDPENSGGILKVTSIDECFNGCNNLTGDIFVSHSSGDLESYANVFSTTNLVYILATSSLVDHSVWQAVANQKSNVTYLSADSDYSYIVNTSNHTYSIKVLNTTKTSYSNPKSTLSSATSWTADSMAGCFENCNKLTESPIIPNTITNMSNCFSGCTALVNAPTIPNTVTNMNSCFNGCTSLQHITSIPANVATMTNCFNNCINLRGNIVVNNETVTSSGIFTNAGSTQNQIYIINGLGSDSTYSTLASTWREIANTNSNVHYEIDNLELPATFTVKRQIYTDNTTESINGYPGAYINSSFSLLFANIKYMPVGWTISWNSTNPVEKMGTTSIGNTITTQADSSKLYFNNITRFLTNNNSNINVTNYYTITGNNKTLTTNRVYNATLSNTSANRNVIDAFYKDSDYIYTIIDNSSTPKKVAAYAFNRNKTGYSNIPSTITVSGTNYTVTSLYYPSYNTSGALDTNNYAGGCFEGCSAMTSAPNNGIPSTITDVRNCFKNCSSLHGNIIVNSNPSNYSNLFTGASTAVAQDIYIINGGKQEIPTFWRSIANSYTKVHFEGDDNPEPLISSIYINRGIYTSEYNTWEEDDTGNWIKLNIYYTLQTSKLPVGWTNQLVKEYYLIFDDEIWDSRPIYMAEETQIVYVQPQSKTLKNTTDYYTKSGDIYTLVETPTQTDLNNNIYWIKGYKNNIVFYFQAANRNGEEINYQTNVKITLTDYLDHEGEKTEIVYAMFAMLDFLPGGHGMAIGQASFREGLEINLPTLIGEELIPPYRTNTLIPTQDHLLVDGKTYYNSAGTAINNPLDSEVEEYYEKVSVVDLNQRQLILGKYNVPDHTEINNQNYKFAYLIVGNGTDDEHRSNLLRVDEDGVTINGLQVNTINGVTVGSSPKFTDNNSFKSFYGTCDTAAATAAKVVTLSVTTGWQLVAGTVVGVKFTNTNTAQNPTLNINGTGAKNIYVNNAVLTTGNLWYAGEAGRIHFYMYDGSQWIFMGHSYDWNSDSKVTQTNSTTNADYRILLSANANDTTETNTSFKNTNLRYNPSTGTLKIKGFDSINSNFKSINCDVSKSEVTAQNSSLTTSSADTDWFQALIKAICVKYPNITNTVFRGTISPNSNRYYEIFIYDTSTVDSTTKLPQHSFGRALNYGGGFTKFGTDSYVWRFGNVDTNTNTTYSAGTGLSLSSTTFSVKLGYTTSGNNRAVQADSSGNLYVTQKDDNSGGTVTKVTAGTGLSIGTTAGGNFTTTGTINHTNSVTAQTTQAVYPIKIDAQGHISAYGSAQTILTIGTGASNAAAGNHTHSYLPLSGGTLTGRLTTADPINQLITGSGTAATTSGSNYVPAKWTFNTGQNASNGDIVTIKIPVAGHDYGIFMSVNNGTNYYPVVNGNGTTRTTTHYPNGTPIMLVFDSSGSADSVYPLAGGTARTTVTGGVWRVVNFYNSTYYYESCYVTTAAGTAAKVGTLSNYALQKGHLQVAIYNANSYAGAITLNINGTGAKPIYINGSASSADNHTLPKGMYLVYYNGTNYYFRTDGKITADIVGSASGNATSGHTHTLSIAADSGTNALTLAASTKYKLTAGGSTFIFTTPPNTITTATTSGTGNAVTAISASNGALTVTKGSTFLTSHQTVTNKGATLAWGSATTVATIGSTNINVSLPSDSKILKFDSGGSLTSAGTLVIDSTFTYSAAITASSGATAPGTITVNKSGYWPLLIAETTKRNGSGGSGHTNWCGNTWELTASSGKAVVNFGGNAAGGAVTKIEVGVKILWVKI